MSETIEIPQVTRTVHITTYQADGCWWARLSEKFHPSTYPEGWPRVSSNHVLFSSDTEYGARQKLIEFVRGAAEALKGGLA